MVGTRTADDLVRKAFRSGEPANLSGSVEGAGGAAREVRAETLAELLTEDRAARMPVARLVGAKVVGRLRLSGAVIVAPVALIDCEFEQPPDLAMARLEGLSLSGCRLPGLYAPNLRVAADLELRDLCSTDTVVLNDAEIGGSVRMSRAQLLVPGGFAVVGERISVRGAWYARRLRTEGELRIPGARVTGNINFSGAQLANPGGDTLDANGIEVSGSFLADRFGRSGTQISRDPERRFVSNGRMLLAGARIGGDLVMSGAQIHRELPIEGPALPPSELPDQTEPGMRLVPRGIIDAAACLVADRIRVAGNLELDDGFCARGTVRLPSAVIGGYLRFSGAELGAADGLSEMDQPSADSVSTSSRVALLGDGMQIGGDLEARNDGAGPLRVFGQLRLAGARVQGNASMTGIELTAPGGDALHGDALTVGSMLFLRRARVLGRIRLQGARIGNTLDCATARLIRPGLRRDGTARPSLDLRAANLGKDVFCNDGFHADGGIRLSSAEVGNSVVVENGTLGADAVAKHYAFDGEGLITLELTLRPSVPPRGRVRLTKTRTRTWRDNEQLWRADGGLDIDGFEYHALGNEASVTERLRWLEGALGVGQYLPGPYEQLAAAYRAEGREEQAERVLLARQLRRYRTQGLAGRVWGELQRVTVGFGYRPWLAVAWLGLFWLLGGLWFSAHPLTRIDTGQVPVWNPWIYTADMLVPIVNLGEKGYWRAEGASQWITSALVVVGWVLATTAARGVARVLKRS